MQQASKMALVAAGTLVLAACSAQQFQDGMDSLGGGVIATQETGDNGIAVYLLDPTDKTQMSHQHTITVTSTPDGEPYAIRISPDVLARHALAFHDGDGGPPQVHLMRVREGHGFGYLHTSFRDQLISALADKADLSAEQAEELFSDYRLENGWWTGEDQFVLHASFVPSETNAGGELGDVLLRYDLSAIDEDDVPQVDDYAFVSPGTDPQAEPGFEPQPHPRRAGDRLTLAQGAVRIDDMATTGGPDDADAADGVIYITS